MAAISIKTRLKKVEKVVRHLEERGLFYGGVGKFKTEDGREIKITVEQFKSFYRQIAAKAWQGEEIEHELLADIKQAKDGIGYYLRCLIG